MYILPILTGGFRTKRRNYSLPKSILNKSFLANSKLQAQNSNPSNAQPLKNSALPPPQRVLLLTLASAPVSLLTVTMNLNSSSSSKYKNRNNYASRHKMRSISKSQ